MLLSEQQSPQPNNCLCSRPLLWGSHSYNSSSQRSHLSSSFSYRINIVNPTNRDNTYRTIPPLVQQSLYLLHKTGNNPSPIQKHRSSSEWHCSNPPDSRNLLAIHA